jgi:type IV secretory pathway VirB2 component (pilin)
MKFCKPKDWVTPPGQASMDDCCPPLAFLGRLCQVVTYPVAAVVSVVGVVVTKNK